MGHYQFGMGARSAIEDGLILDPLKDKAIREVIYGKEYIYDQNFVWKQWNYLSKDWKISSSIAWDLVFEQGSLWIR